MDWVITRKLNRVPSTNPFFVEIVILERTCVAVCLMVLFAVYVYEGIGTVLFLFCFELWRISLQVLFIVLCLLSMVFGVIRSITFYIPGLMYLAC